MAVEATRQGYQRNRLTGVDVTGNEPLVVRLVDGLTVTGTVVDARTGQPVTRFAASIRRIGDLDPAQNGTIAQQLARRAEVLAAEAAGEGDVAASTAKFRLVEQLRERARRLQRERPTLPVRVPTDIGPVASWPGGRFELGGLEAGLYAVAISSPDHRFAEQQPIEVRQATAAPSLRFALVPGVPVRGVVVSAATGRAVAGAEVDLVQLADPASVVAEQGPETRSLVPWLFARDARPGTTVTTMRSDGDGAFTFAQVAAGRFAIAVRHAGFAQFQSGEVVVGTADGPPPIRCALASLATLQGRVTGVPAALSGQVHVVALGGRRGRRSPCWTCAAVRRSRRASRCRTTVSCCWIWLPGRHGNARLHGNTRAPFVSKAASRRALRRRASSAG